MAVFQDAKFCSQVMHNFGINVHLDDRSDCILCWFVTKYVEAARISCQRFFYCNLSTFVKAHCLG